MKLSEEEFRRGIKIGAAMERVTMDREEYSWYEAYELWLEQKRENKQLQANTKRAIELIQSLRFNLNTGCHPMQEWWDVLKEAIAILEVEP